MTTLSITPAVANEQMIRDFQASGGKVVKVADEHGFRP